MTIMEKNLLNILLQSPTGSLVEEYLVKNPDRKNKILIPLEDQEILDELNIIKNKVIIAGGACLQWYRGLPLNKKDIDLWFNSEEHLKEFQTYFFDIDKFQHQQSFLSKDAETYDVTFNDKNYRIQFIKKFYNSVEDLFENFDISVCKIATDGSKWYLGENFAKDLKDKRLRITRFSDNTVKRLIKYWSYGFEPDAETLKKIVEDKNTKWEYLLSESGDY